VLFSALETPSIFRALNLSSLTLLSQTSGAIVKNTLADANLEADLWNNITVDSNNNIRGDINTTYALDYETSGIKVTSRGKEKVAVKTSIIATNWQRFEITSAPLTSPAGHSNQIVHATNELTTISSLNGAETFGFDSDFPLDVTTRTKGTNDSAVIVQVTNVNQTYCTISLFFTSLNFYRQDLFPDRAILKPLNLPL
jgi:hypothetical protein